MSDKILVTLSSEKGSVSFQFKEAVDFDTVEQLESALSEKDKKLLSSFLEGNKDDLTLKVSIVRDFVKQKTMVGVKILIDDKWIDADPNDTLKLTKAPRIKIVVKGDKRDLRFYSLIYFSEPEARAEYITLKIEADKEYQLPLGDKVQSVSLFQQELKRHRNILKYSK